MAEMVETSRRLYDRLLSVQPHLVLIFARGALPLGFSLVWRLERDGRKEYLSDGDTDGNVIHIFPGLVNQQWPSLSTDSIEFFHREMEAVLNKIAADPLRIFISDTTRSGNSLNVELNELKKLAGRTRRNIEAHFEPVLDAKTNPQLGQNPTWDVGQQRVIRPRLFGDRKYIDIEGKLLPLSKFFSARVQYHMVSDLFTEDYKELLGGEIMRGWPVMAAVQDSGQFVYVSDAGSEPAGSSGIDSSGYRLPFHLAERAGSNFSPAQWRGLACQTESAPVPMSWVVDAMSQPCGPDAKYELKMAEQPEALTDGQIGWMGEYATGRGLVAKLRVRLSNLPDDGVKESALAYLRRAFPGKAGLEPNDGLDRSIKWWIRTLEEAD